MNNRGEIWRRCPVKPDMTWLTLVVIAGLTGNLLVSCNKPAAEAGEAAVTAPVPDMSAPIEFSDEIVPETKGLDPMSNALEGIVTQRFGVFSWWNPKGTVFDAVTNPANYYQQNNDVYRLEGGAGDATRKWCCNPRAYWPFGCNLSFFAYAPYLEHTQPYTVGSETVQPDLRFPSADYTQGMPRATYTPNTNVTQQVDLCLAAPVFDREPSATPILFEFKHALTRIRIYVKAKGERIPGYDYRIDDAIITGVAGSNTFTYNDDADTPFIWDAVTSSTPLDAEYHLKVSASQLSPGYVNLLSEHPGTDPSTYTYVNGSDAENGRLYLLPQTITSEAKLELGIGMYRVSGTVLTSVLPPFKTSLPTTQAWLPGATIAYLVTVDVSKYVVLDIVPLVTPWEDAGNTHAAHIIY